VPEAPREAGSPTPPRLELRLERGRASVGLGAGPIGDGLVLLDLELEVAGLPSPFDPGAGTAPFRSLPCALRRLVVASSAAPPAATALDALLVAALAQSGWPPPDTAGLVHSTWSDERGTGASWVRPADHARAMLASARAAGLGGEADQALRLALAGHAAIAAGLAPEGEAALRAALEAGLGRDDAREAWRALVASARAAGDDAAERHGLAGLVPAAPTGERPALLLRLSALDLAAGDPTAARVHAEEARTLAPRSLDTNEACLACALRAGDDDAVVDLLDRLATLEPATAGDRLLDRARRLASAGRLVEADAGFRDALARLPASRALADEHAALRRTAPPPVGRHPWGEPLETFAGRAADAPESALAFRDAALLAREQGDLPSALRAARHAHERSGDVAFAGELLASLLHAGGSVQEALDLHRILLAQAAHTLDPAALVDRLTALAELAEEAGDRPLAVESLDRLLEQRPHDAQALEWRFRVDPDRGRALDRLVAGAEELRSRHSRTGLLVLAAASARDEAHDTGRQRDLIRRAAEAAAGSPASEREVALELLALCRADPSDAESARSLQQLLAGDPRALAEAFQAIADAAAPGRVRASHLVTTASALAEAGEAIRHREAVQAAFEAWPLDEATFRGALAWAEGDVDATDAVLCLRAAAVPGEAAACHRARADLLVSAGRPGPAARAYEACLASDPSDGDALAGLTDARAAEGDLAGALSAARRGAEVAAIHGLPADRRRALERGARLAAELGDRGEDAASVLESLALLVLEGAPGVDAGAPDLVSRAAAALDAAGEELRAASLRSRAGIAPPEPERSPLDLAPETGPEPSGARIAELLRPLLASARSLADAGELGAAYARLKLAREIDPDHLDLSVMLARLAERLGHFDEAVSLGEAWGDAVAGTDPAAAAARYRELAAITRTRLSDPDRATALLLKAAAIEPADPSTEAALSELGAGRRGQALELLASRLESLRERPSSIGAAKAVAALSRGLSAAEPEARDRATRAERSAVAGDLARFGDRLGPAGRPVALAAGISPEVRTRVALPGADGPTARLLSLLAPYLEPLFPVDLARHGVGPADRLAPSSAPAVQSAFEGATRALGGRTLVLLAGRRPGLQAVLENTRPPSAVLGTDVAALPPGALAFLAARSVALASSCWALLGRFAPRDVLILSELASRFAGGEPPPRGLPASRAGDFLAALERSVPAATREVVASLGPASAGELALLDPVAFAAAIEETACRLALLHAGDLHGALSVLSRLPRLGLVAPADPLAALDRPDLASLSRFALSDAWLELRGMLLGWV
jgi:tetratricopeptide (TPR) repeat protein